MTRICPKCGQVIEENARFCDECGEALSNVPTVNAEAVPIAPMTSKTNRNTSFQTTKTNISHSSKALGVIALIFGIVSIVTLGCFYIPEIVAIICGVLSKDSNGKRTELGKAGLICGIIGAVLLGLIAAVIIIML